VIAPGSRRRCRCRAVNTSTRPRCRTPGGSGRRRRWRRGRTRRRSSSRLGQGNSPAVGRVIDAAPPAGPGAVVVGVDRIDSRREVDVPGEISGDVKRGALDGHRDGNGAFIRVAGHWLADHHESAAALDDFGGPGTGWVLGALTICRRAPAGSVSCQSWLGELSRERRTVSVSTPSGVGRPPCRYRSNCWQDCSPVIHGRCAGLLGADRRHSTSIAEIDTS
jgi:hypothetical protein